jgi:hypothetical protein
MGADVIQRYECWDPTFRLDDGVVLTTLLRQLVHVSPAVRQLAQSIRQASHLSSPYLAVHLRTGRLDRTANHFTKNNHSRNWTAVVECAMNLCFSSSSSYSSSSLSDENTTNDSPPPPRPPQRLPVYVATDDESLTQQLERQFRSEPPWLHTNTRNDTTLVHYVDGGHSADDARRRAWAEWYLLSRAICVVPTDQSKYSLSAGLYAGCVMAMEDVCHHHHRNSDATTTAAAAGDDGPEQQPEAQPLRMIQVCTGSNNDNNNSSSRPTPPPP